MTLPMLEKNPPRVLTIAGSDSGGGAGVEADLKTFTALGIYGMAAITVVTVQDTIAIHAVHDVPPIIVGKQIETALSDIGADAVKTGMIGSTDALDAVATALAAHTPSKLVVDPVMVSETGHRLLEADATQALITRLLPLASVVTPNISEAEALSGRRIDGEKNLLDAAKAIHAHGVANVLITGGHLDTDEAVDYLYDGTDWIPFGAPRIETSNNHGTGCTYSSAIAAFLARGCDLPHAIREAKTYVTGALRASFNLGAGAGPLNHFWRITT